MNNPSVTVLIPNLNGCRYLRESVLSALRQDYFCDVLVVDNGSSDDSLKILNELENKFSNFRYIVESKRGIVQALNTGLKNISTDYVARLDSDDIMKPNRISKQINCFSENTSLILLGSAIENIDECGNLKSITKYPGRHELILKSLQYRNTFAHPSVMFKTNIVKQVGLYRSEFEGAEDLDLWLRLINKGQLGNIDEPLTKYRIHSNQVTLLNNYYKIELKVRINWLINNYRYNDGLNYLLIALRLIDLFLVSRNFKLHRKLIKR